MLGRGRAVYKSTRQIVAESNQIGVQFLLADLAVGITFLNVAEVTQIGATRSRNVRSAREAYETVLRLLPRVTPSEDEQALLNAKIAELKQRLMSAGVVEEPESQGGSKAETRI